MKKILIILFVLTGIQLFSQISQLEYILPDSNVVFVDDSVTKVIFGKNFRERIQLKVGRIKEYNPRSEVKNKQRIEYKPYVPSTHETKTLDSLLLVYFRSVEGQKAKGSEYIIRNFKNYIFQYLGYINATGEKIIWINCANNDQNMKADFYWKKKIIHVFDGGPQYFNIQYNKKKKAFLNLYINGFA